MSIRRLCQTSLCVLLVAYPLGVLSSSQLWAQEAQTSPVASPSAFPSLYDSEPELDELLSPQQALDSLRLPPGFTAKLFSAEPDVQNPIAAHIDAAGRVWVAENYTYAERSQRFDLSLRDRVVVLEDTDADGVADRRTVFTDTVQMLTGIVVGQGGVWLMCPPQLLFIPDADGDLVPDGPPQIKLDGFRVARENYHNFANGLSWGPDGWLYGRCGASCAGEMGRPGTSDDARVPIRGGIWRYHPIWQTVEAITQGTTNPWGHDWNSVGDLFYINTVNGHLWHAIPGAHFVRPHTIDANPHTYELIDMHADHWHFDTGQSWTKSRGGAANDYGGGHAHVGMMIYQDDHWPEQYRGKLMTVNMHGRRVNTELLEREGSGYVARHVPDFALSDDTWFRGMDLLPCQDGNVLLIDWSDTGECHDHTGVHRTSGRIFKIEFSTSRKRPSVNVAGLNARELAEMQIHGSEWEARRARDILRSSGEGHGKVPAETLEILRTHLNQPEQTVVRLRCLWTLYQLDAIDQDRLLSLLDDSDDMLRAWAVRLLTDRWEIDHSDGQGPLQRADVDARVVRRLVELAQGESSATVRLTLATVLQRLPHDQRRDLALPLFAHADGHDHNIPLLVWYGIMPLGDERLDDLVQLFPACAWTNIRRHIARRIVDQIDSSPQHTDQLLRTALHLEVAAQTDLIQGMSTALAGRRQEAMPSGWPALTEQLLSQGQPDDATRAAIQQLNVLFGSGIAVEELTRLAADGNQSLDVRKAAALVSLSSSRAADIQGLRMSLLSQRFLNIVAAEGLAGSDDPAVGTELIKRFRSLHQEIGLASFPS
ncbi:MAG: cytochrome C [Pirellulaceae bacterium]